MTRTRPETHNDQRAFFASCAKSLEPLLAEELHAAGATGIKQTVAGVHFTGTLATACHLCVFSRLANRVISIVHTGPVSDADSLYRATQQVDWSVHLEPDHTLAVRATGTTDALRHTRFIAQKVKDAVVDQLMDRGLTRPSVSRTEPDLLIHTVIKRGQVTLGIDLVGSSLHRRHYRQEQGVAPLKETLAAALLIRAGWPELMHRPGAVIRDPLCGAGTLLIEAVLMAMDIAPGLLREKPFSAWPGHDRAVIETVLDEARKRREKGANWKGLAIGSDSDRDIIQKARRNAERAGIYDHVDIEYARLEDASSDPAPALIICNPPYAERLGEEPETLQLYQTLGQFLIRQSPGTAAAVFTGRPEWGRLLGLHSHKQYTLYNGALKCSLLCFNIAEDTIYQKARQTAGAQPQELDSGAQMLANRLRKNLKSIGKWARQQHHECYRLYDADMPEYAFAIDIYGDRVHMQEYRAPATVREEDAAHRRRQAIQAVQSVLEVPPEHISLKLRQRQRGNEQYSARDGHGGDFVVSEGPARFRVNLHRYLDTGLFLDHRPVRLLIRQLAHGKRFLNLFCYTGTATVHAALGGAQSTTSVDLSSTYLDWAKTNLELNGISPWQHRLVKMDCLEWLKRNREQFDLIFLDPPTFSNSKSTSNVLDIQRDHGSLVELCMSHLAPDGLLIFSTNKRRFALNDEVAERFDVEDISKQTIDRDFARHPDIHHTWLVRHHK